MKHNALEMTLLLDYYGELLTEKQKQVYELHYQDDLSLTEIGDELSISRQAVHDTLTRTEQLLKNMEAKTGCVRRDQSCRRAVAAIGQATAQLRVYPDASVAALADRIDDALREIEE